MKPIKQNGLVEFLTRVFIQLGRNDGTTMAASVAYYAFLSIFPLILGLIGLMGLILPSQNYQEQIFGFLQQNLPSASDVIRTNIQSVIQYRGTLGIVGVLGLLWSGSTLINITGHVINRVWDISQELQYYLKKLRDIGLTVGMGILFILSLASTAASATAISLLRLEGLPLIGAFMVQFGAWIVALLLMFLIFVLLYKLMPNTQTYWRHIWPMAFFTAILFEIGRSLFVLYLNNFTNYALVYGTVGSIIALLIWIYYSAVIALMGAEMAAEFSRMRRGIGMGVHSHSDAHP